MALSGFGLNAAVQAFPAMYEFGRSLFGQDNASKAQAFKEKQAEAELAMKQREMDDMAAYRAGVLRGQDFQNQTSRMGVENAYNLGNRGLANQEYDSVTRATLGFGNLGVAQEHNRISRDQVNNAFTLGQGNLKVAQGQLGVAQQQANDIRDFRTASIEAEKARIRQEGERIGLSRQQIEAQIGHLNEQTRGLRLDNNFQDNLDKELAAESSLEERFQNDPLSLSEKDLTKLGMRYNRHAKEAATAFNEAADRWVASNGRDMNAFSPEVVAAVGRGIQPLLDANKDYPAGSLQLEGFEPANENGMGGVRVKLRKTVKGEDGQMHTTSTYLTEGRGELADGAKPRIFTGQELNQMLSGLQSVGELQEKHGDLSADMQDKLEARKMSKNYQEFARNYRILRDERMAAMGRAEDKAAKLVKDQAAQAAANTRDVMTALDNVHPIRQLQPEDAPATPEYQALMAEREKLQSIIGQQLSKGELEDLEAGDPVGIMAHPDVAKQYEKYKSLYQRYAPPSTNTTLSTEQPKHPQQGAFYHPGVQSSGGGASPFSQAAPERGGSYQPASYRPQQPLAMPKNLQIMGTAKQFGVEKVDPALMEGVKAAAQLWPGKVDLFSSGRGKGDKGNHSSWHALDVGLITPEGQYLPNHIKKKWHGGGSGAAHMYERFWQAAVLWAAQDDPSILNRFRWGGNFREQDYMHGDTLRGVGGKTTGAGTLFGGRDTRYGGGKTMPVQDLNALGRQLYGGAWRGIPGLQRMA